MSDYEAKRLLFKSSFYNHFEKKSKTVIKTLNLNVLATNVLSAVFSGYTITS